MSDKINSLKDLYYYVVMKEAGKSIVSRSDVIEIIRILSDLSQTNPEIFDLISKNGKRRNIKEKTRKAELKGIKK